MYKNDVLCTCMTLHLPWANWESPAGRVACIFDWCSLSDEYTCKCQQPAIEPGEALCNHLVCSAKVPTSRRKFTNWDLKPRPFRYIVHVINYMVPPSFHTCTYIFILPKWQLFEYQLSLLSLKMNAFLYTIYIMYICCVSIMKLEHNT